MCRPVDGSREAACPGGHIGPPLHNAGNVPEITESGVENDHFPNGAGRSPPPTGGAEQSGASAPAGARKWVGIAAKIIPKGAINLGQSLSQPAADSSLCTREPWGRGMRIAASARWASSQLQRFPVIPRSGATWESVPFYDGRGFGPPRSSAPTPRGGRGNGTPGSSCPTGGRREVSSIAGAALSEAESAERAAGQIRSLPDDLRAQHGVLGSEV